MTTGQNIHWAKLQGVAAELLRAAERVEQAVFTAESPEDVAEEPLKKRLAFITAASIAVLFGLGVEEDEMEALMLEATDYFRATKSTP